MAAQYHFGVYARIRDGARLLLVRKTRGPYAGLLDLPGGQPEAEESWQQTLERELHEELGVRLPVAGEFTAFSIHVQPPRPRGAQEIGRAASRIWVGVAGVLMCARRPSWSSILDW
ncbi:NUDIX domain-containing protein [Kribbella aluminosa]|uniref:NUDIX domain-containing protein n=1 Tax=Kribbella aluminosa TaxID=416017 RepID=UPI001AE59F4F|nr:NUDIX domain-containing protein [Kribbella aluminosa]